MKTIGLRLSLAIVALCFGTTALPQTQEPKAVKTRPKTGQAAPAASKPELRVFSLRNLSADEMAGTINQLMNVPDMPPIRVVGDGRSGRLIVWAEPAQMETIQRLLAELDKPVEASRNEFRMRTFPLKRSDFNVLKEALKVLPVQIKFAFDAPSRQMVVSGADSDLEMVAALVERIDQAPPPSTRRNWQVRVAWLATGEATGSEPPADLQEVVAELEKIGVRDPRLITQAVASVSTDGRFTLQGAASLNVTQAFRVHGSLTVVEPGPSPTLHISVGASPLTAPKAGQMNSELQLETTTSAPLGHSVVLGMTPSGSSNSIFVVQVLEKPIGK
jgi:hypothetical protein